MDIAQTELLCLDMSGEKLGFLDKYGYHISCIRSKLQDKQEISPSTETGMHRTVIC